jgi:hypothetical protein
MAGTAWIVLILAAIITAAGNERRGQQFGISAGRE